MKTTLYLIRHGETDWNLNGIWQGHADVPLNDIGRAQARRLAERMRAENQQFDAIYSSDLQRAWETARAVGDAANVPVQPLPTLREIDVGTWSGRTNAQIIVEDEDTYERIRSGEDLPRGGAERFLDLYDRVVGATEQLAAKHFGKTLALVTHGGVIRALILHAARNKRGIQGHRVHIGNTSISVVCRSGTEWAIERINDMEHLEASPQAPDMMSAPPDDAERP